MTHHIQRTPVMRLNDQRIISGKIHLIGEPPVVLLEQLVSDPDDQYASLRLYTPFFYVGSEAAPNTSLIRLLPPQPIYYAVRLDNQTSVYTPICRQDRETSQWQTVSHTDQDAMIRVAQEYNHA